ncbi:MAG TPA: peptidoglycan-binding protein [Gaiellaceae bacterium]|nr:peptidoglycan-binding protein [Gaiellaceae bacterium]
MRGGVVIAAVLAALVVVPVAGAASPRVAAVQVALRARGLYPGPVDGIAGPLTRTALVRFQSRRGLLQDGRVGPRTRQALGVLGRPLLGRRELWVGRVGWDVSSLEFRLRRFGLAAAAVDGRFDGRTRVALRRFQRARGLAADGIAGTLTYRALLGGTPAASRPVHVVQPGESFFAIAQRYRVSPWRLANENGYRLDGVIVPGVRLRLPVGASTVRLPEDRDAVRASLDRWAGVYGVDPQLARALAWMESGFQNHVVSSVGARGVMQLLPETWDFVETVLLGEQVPDTADGNVRVGVRYLRWQLDHFGGDVRLALAGWYQGARAVREVGLYDDTQEFVRIVLALYGTV